MKHLSFLALFSKLKHPHKMKSAIQLPLQVGHLNLSYFFGFFILVWEEGFKAKKNVILQLLQFSLALMVMLLDCFILNGTLIFTGRLTFRFILDLLCLSQSFLLFSASSFIVSCSTACLFLFLSLFPFLISRFFSSVNLSLYFIFLLPFEIGFLMI